MSTSRKQTMDGNTAAAHVSYAFIDAAIIYPITPSSPMAESIDEWAAAGKKNIFGHPVALRQMQSEGGAAGTLHGCLQGGALTATYTASQGLLLMIPNMYKIAGELLPGVFHVSARSLASNALSIFGDHQDVMAARQTGFSLLASSNVQQCMDLGAVAHLAAIESRIPALHFFDGFRTSHELQKIELLEYDDLMEIIDMDAVDRFRSRSLNPDNPVLRGTTQNPDVFFQTREAVNKFYVPLPDIFQKQMDRISALTGRHYRLFNYHGAKTAAHVIIAMGSACDVIRETIDHLNRDGSEYGLLEVHLYRPFSTSHMLKALPETVKRISVLDRTKEPGAPGEPLFLDVKNAFYGKNNPPLILGGIYGLASKEFSPANVREILENMSSKSPKNRFTVGIQDDVTFRSLPFFKEPFNPTPEDTIACKFWGLGSDGTVGANKSAVKIIGDHTDKFVQAYFAYDAKKSGGVTISHLRFGDSEIRSSYQITNADFIACHNQAYVNQYDLLDVIKPKGTFLLNCIWAENELAKELPADLKKTIAEKEVNFFTINAVDIAKELGLGNRINMIMQSAFFKLTKVISPDDAARHLQEEVEKNYGRKGKNIVDMNCRAIERGMTEFIKINVPESWKYAAGRKEAPANHVPEFVEKILIPMNRQKGDSLPVSAFNGNEDGTYPTGTTKYEKRAIAIFVADWNPEKCIQCNQCAFVCPHAVLRPLLLSDEQVAQSPPGMTAPKALGKGYEGHYFMGLSALDCTGCANCVDVCPAKEKAIELKPLADKRDTYVALWDYVKDLEPPELTDRQLSTVKGSQFLKPLIEFSGACAGCGETPYAKLITQLFGDRMVISNSAGCATVWGGSAPSVPYTKNNLGHGPAWGFSLFEDNAEYGYGMHVGAKTIRMTLASEIRNLLGQGMDSTLVTAMKEWLEGMDKAKGSRARAQNLSRALKPFEDDPRLKGVARKSHLFVKHSNWVFGGDGWAYDIGFGGLDHVMASGENINIMVFDTEVYSNTGGQSSKATPTGAIAKFAASGKQIRKKDLGLMMMSYGYVYVAQIAIGADKNQALKAICEAEAYEGPSLIIGYAPCVNHGIKAGMEYSHRQARRAVESGYWTLYRHNPMLKAEGKNPFMLDSNPPEADFEEFLMSEVRYASLMQQDPVAARRLFTRARKEAMERIDHYRQLSSRTTKPDNSNDLPSNN
jgi:pyruvate-ferredoxin/flavodoxin oxidoreductase